MKVVPVRHPSAPPDSTFHYFTPDKVYEAYTKRGEFCHHVIDDLGHERVICRPAQDPKLHSRSPHLWPSPATDGDREDWRVAGHWEPVIEETPPCTT